MNAESNPAHGANLFHLAFRLHKVAAFAFTGENKLTGSALSKTPRQQAMNVVTQGQRQGMMIFRVKDNQRPGCQVNVRPS